MFKFGRNKIATEFPDTRISSLRGKNSVAPAVAGQAT